MKSRIRRLSYQGRRRWQGMLFVLPLMIGLLLFGVIPLIRALVFSFCELKVTADGYTLSFVGGSNYYRIFAVDPNSRRYLLEWLKNMALNLPITIIFSFFVASLLNTRFVGRTAARMILFLPIIFSSGIVQSLMQNDLMSSVLSSSSSGGVVGESQGLATAFVSLMNQIQLNNRLVQFVVDAVNRVSEITNMAAVPIIIFLAGLQTISPSVFEAAHVEGATPWESFWKISLPIVSPQILVCLVYCIINSATDVSSRVIRTLHDAMFDKLQMGEGTAMAFSYMLLSMLFLVLVYRVVSRFVFYQDR